MHTIIFYRDRKGNSPIRDYLDELEMSESKDSRIKRNKIREYVKALEANGTNLPETTANTLKGRYGS